MAEVGLQHDTSARLNLFLWSHSLNCHRAPLHTQCSRTTRSPQFKQVCFSWLAKENDFPSLNLLVTKKTPQCAAGYHVLSPAQPASAQLLNFTEATQLLSSSLPKELFVKQRCWTHHLKWRTTRNVSNYVLHCLQSRTKWHSMTPAETGEDLPNKYRLSKLLHCI